MTTFSGVFNKKVFDGNTILLKTSGECNRHRYVYIGGIMICSFVTNDNFSNYISNLGINLTPYSIAIGQDNIYFLITFFKFIKRDKKDYENSDDLYDYYLPNCEKDFF